MAIALGNFDGVHRGHQQVIAPVLDYCDTLCPSVVTFDPHPQEVLTGKQRLLLTPTAEKAQDLHSRGIVQLVIIPFDQQMAQLSPQEFVRQILRDHLQAQVVSVGEDFRFGYRRSGTVEDLRAIASQHSIKVLSIPLQQCEEGRISSSQIRLALAQGNLAQAKRLLGRPYRLMGKVISGQQLGRTLGFPTANLQLPPEKFLPRRGVYSVRAWGAPWDREHPKIGVMNLGCRPTVHGNQLTAEVHLLNWSGNLYDCTLCVELEAFLRPEQQFSSLDALKSQIQVDCETAQAVLSPSTITS